MDPVTITATVVTFATAVKDLVELGQKIHESFAKVSKNRRSAQRAAASIKDMIGDINTIYQNHQEALTNMEEFDLALKDLLEKFRGFETSILPLVPQTRGSWISMAFLRGWWNNNKIKESILNLEADVREVKQRYMVKSAMRTEVKLEVVHQDATRNFADISHEIELVRTDVHAMRVSTTVAPIAPTTLGTSDERERNIVLFVRSAMSKSASLLRPPDEVTEEVMMTVFIKAQIAWIEAEVDKLPMLRVSDPINIPPFCLILHTASFMDVSFLRRTVVQHMLELRDILSDSDGLRVISIDNASIKLHSTSTRLKILGMLQEALLVCSWAVRLARTLVNLSHGGDTQHRARLAFSLSELSSLHRSSGDVAHAQREFEEAFSITETLLSQGCADAQIEGLYLDLQTHEANHARNDESTIKSCIQLLEGIFVVQSLLRVDAWDGPAGAIMDPSYDFVNHAFSSSAELIMIDRCAETFLHLAGYMLRAGWSASDNAKRLVHLCIALRRRMVLVQRSESDLAYTLSTVCQGELAQCFTAGELLDMVDECALLFRQLTQNNPVYHSQNLLHILWKRADILDQLNRNSDSVSTREEAVRLAGEITGDFELQADALFRLAQALRNANRHLDAARTIARIPAIFLDESHGSLYGYLSHDLLKTRHYKESAEAASNSIAIYRKLKPAGPAQEMEWTCGLVVALSALAQSQIALGDHTRGFSSLNESVVIASNTLNVTVDTAPNILRDYLDAFTTHVGVSSLHDKEFTIDPESTPIQTLKCLVARHPRNKDVFEALADTQVSFAYHLYRLGRLRDALAYADQSLDAWTSREDPALDDKWFTARMKQIKAQTLDAQGYRLDAMWVIQNLRSTVGHNYYMFLTRVYWVQLSVDRGDREKGLEVAEEVLVQSRSKQGTYRLILSLFGVAYAALHNQNYEHTMEAAGEGIELSAAPEWVADENEADISIRPSLFAIMSSATANTGNLDRAMHYAQQAVTLSLDIAERKHNISATTAKHSLMETRGYLAEILLATGEVTQAREICHERKIYFTERVENKDGDPRLGEYRDLAPVLRMLGVLCCHEGHHKEGEAAAQQLTEIIRRLGLTFPSLLEQVKNRLRYQASVPIMKVLDEMTEKLECEHQKGIKALFEV